MPKNNNLKKTYYCDIPSCASYIRLNNEKMTIKKADKILKEKGWWISYTEIKCPNHNWHGKETK